MDPTRQFGKAFGFDNSNTYEKEPIATPPSTITRRREKIPRSLTLQSYESPTEPPTDTPVLNDEEIYDNEPSTPTPNRRRLPIDTRASRARIPRADASILPLPLSANEQTI